MINIAKNLLLLASAAILLLPTACKDRMDNPEDPEQGDQIRLGVAGQLVTTKTPGSITDITQMTENLAVYSTTFTVQGGTTRKLTWPATPLIGTTTATVVTSPADSPNLGELKYYTDKPTPFPEQYTAVYALFPSGGSTGVNVTYAAGNGPIDEPATTIKGGPKAEVTIQNTAATQYDILYANIVDLRRESLMNKQRAKIVFNHSLAQLKFRVYGENTLSGPLNLTKVVVNALSQGTLSDTTGTYTDVKTPIDMTMYDGAAIALPIASAPPATANVPTNLMLFPATQMTSVKSVTLTINGQTYKLDIKTPGFDLEKGKINVVTLKMTPLGLKLDEMAGNTISTWIVGAESNENTNVVKYKTAFSLKLQNSKIITQTPYTANGAMTAEVQINNTYWLEHTNVDQTKTKLIPCSLTGGVMSFTEQEPTLMLNDDPIYLTHLRIYDNGVKIFDDEITKGEILIPKTLTGALEYVTRPGVPMMANVLFSGFGEGSTSYPYMVQNVDLLKKLKNFTSSSDLAIDNLNFKQTVDLDLDPELTSVVWTPIGDVTNKFYGSYDGNNLKIKNLIIKTGTTIGLFGVTGAATGSAVTQFKNLTIENGSITSSSSGASLLQGAGAVIGTVYGSTTLTNVHNKGVAVSTKMNNGGIVGTVVAGTNVIMGMINCSNNAAISCVEEGRNNSAGGIIGRSTAATATSLTNCHNMGEIQSLVNAGGIAGVVNSNAITVSQCSNKTNVTCTSASTSIQNKAGGLVGEIALKGSVKPSEFTIINSFNSGKVTAQTLNAGGLVGCVIHATDVSRITTVKGCYSTGAVETKMVTIPTSGAALHDGIGGLFGNFYAGDGSTGEAVTIQNCYAAADVVTPASSNASAAYMIGRQRSDNPKITGDVVNTYFQTGLSTTGGRDQYGPSGGKTALPSTDLKTQAGLDLINTGTAYYKANAGGFPKLLWEK